MMNTSEAENNLSSNYDVIVIGGGIQGAGITLLARAAGYSVLQIEQNTWASGTSSKSSKLIHGGLRYLQSGQFKLVYECLAERAWMLKKMPDLVKPNWFYIPIYKQSRYRKWKVHLGLFLYRLLSGNSACGQYKIIPSSQWSTLAGINQTDLVAVLAYQDAQTDDAELTRTVVARAQALGATCVEHMQCLAGELCDDGLFQLKLAKDGKKHLVSAHTVINATGPWVNHTLNILGLSNEILPVDLVQGSHLVVSPQLSDACFYMEAPQDGRAVFCLPWKGKSLIGTTELIYQGDPSDATLTSDERVYLTEVVMHYFPQYAFSIDEHFCGLRVLPKSDKKAFLRTRDTIIYSSPSTHHRVISLYGGKLTAWRATAHKVLKVIDKGFGKKSIINVEHL